jgi:antitoxin PrlF
MLDQQARRAYGNTKSITFGGSVKITIKGQVTIPKDIREKLGIQPLGEVDFVEEQGRIFLVKKAPGEQHKKRFAQVRGSATARMSTEEIMRLTRGAE